MLVFVLILAFLICSGLTAAKKDEFFRKMASLGPEEPILKEDLDNYYTNALNATSVLYNIGVDELREELLSHEN